VGVVVEDPLDELELHLTQISEFHSFLDGLVDGCLPFLLQVHAAVKQEFRYVRLDLKGVLHVRGQLVLVGPFRRLNQVGGSLDLSQVSLELGVQGQGSHTVDQLVVFEHALHVENIFNLIPSFICKPFDALVLFTHEKAAAQLLATHITEAEFEVLPEVEGSPVLVFGDSGRVWKVILFKFGECLGSPITFVLVLEGVGNHLTFLLQSGVEAEEPKYHQG